MLIDCGELLVRFAELVHRLLQQSTLGRHIEVDVVVDEDVDYPVAEAGRRHRDALHVRVVELGVGRFRSARALGTHFSLVLQQQVVLVEVDERFEELVDGRHQFLRLAPCRLDLLDLPLGRHHVLHRVAHLQHHGRGRRHRLELGERRLVERVERFGRRRDGGLGRH